jgi:hypothetical protein
MNPDALKTVGGNQKISAQSPFLPATIPGLIRRCSPVLVQTETGLAASVIHATKDQTLYAPVDGNLYLPSVCWLDLSDPTGIDHAVRYVAEAACQKAGWPVPLSVMACHQQNRLVGLYFVLSFEGSDVARQVYCLSRENGGNGLMNSKYNDNIPTYCIEVVGVGRTETISEALRLAVLAVAGSRE